MRRKHLPPIIEATLFHKVQRNNKLAVNLVREGNGRRKLQIMRKSDDRVSLVCILPSDVDAVIAALAQGKALATGEPEPAPPTPAGLAACSNGGSTFPKRSASK